MKQHNYFVYILASENWTLYVWVTNNLERRVLEHKKWLIEWFTKKYRCNKLVYFENWSDVNLAITREKQLKWWLRFKKEKLIKIYNPSWEDLSQKWF
ncbi:MAG: hypothetical protein ACD_3C00083G0002 [uncultured bacterium (gcode 4)]|uniref:GIY-YIG domain-containing protein n=1 Tax=uncultured bacterium (gcode 4) TaxID=1234023 RepID=K2FZ68_9BACT|nr:MAG: hypothetical protein ACD_3C00083G0002 [uncultured bacterium (gcode 4)]